MQTAQIIQFPTKLPVKEKTKGRQIKNVDGIKYLTEPQVKALRRTVRDQAATGKMTAIREWMAIDILVSAGLRVSKPLTLGAETLGQPMGKVPSLFMMEKEVSPGQWRFPTH